MFWLLIIASIFIGMRFVHVLWQRYMGDQVSWTMWGISLFVMLAGISFTKEIQQFYSHYVTNTFVVLLPTLFGTGAYTFGTYVFIRDFLPFFKRPTRCWGVGAGGLLTVIITVTIVLSFVIGDGDSQDCVWICREIIVPVFFSGYVIVINLRYVLPALAWMFLVEEGPISKCRSLVWSTMQWLINVWMVFEIAAVVGWLVLGWPFRGFDQLRPVLAITVGALWLMAFFAPAKWLARLGFALLHLAHIANFILLWIIERRIQKLLGIRPLSGFANIPDLILRPDDVTYDVVIRIFDYRKLLLAQEPRSYGWLLGKQIGLVGKYDVGNLQMLRMFRQMGAQVVGKNIMDLCTAFWR